MFDILYTKLIVNLKFVDDSILPSIKTSALRGGLGQMLLINNCIKDRRCNTCQLKHTCVFKNIFNREIHKFSEKSEETSSASFIIRCDNTKKKIKKNEIISFEITVFQDSIALLPMLFEAIDQLGEFGLGSKGNQFVLEGIYNINGELVYRDGRRNNSKIVISTINDYVVTRKKELFNIKGIEFITPFRIKRNGKFAKDVNEDMLVRAIIRRLETLKNFVGESIEIEEDKISISFDYNSLVWIDDFERYSSKQDTYMTFGGLKGEIRFLNTNNLMNELLIAGELIALGKNTAFGLGKYRVVSE